MTGRAFAGDALRLTTRTSNRSPACRGLNRARRGASWPLLLLFLSIAACTGQTKRIHPDALSEAETGTGLTSQDLRSVCERMARSLIHQAQIQNATTPPRIALWEVENASNDYVDADEFTHKIRTLLIKHAEGKLIFLDRTLRGPIRSENRDKTAGRVTASSDEVEHGADYYLTGRISSLDRAAGGGMTSYHRLSFRLTHAATSDIIWEDEYEIKKAARAAPIYK